MTPLEIILEAQKKPLTTQDGDADPLNLAPPLSEDEISAFEAELPCKLPPEIRELLSRCRGFTGGAADFVDFTGKNCNFGQEEVFPYGLPIAADGFGNFWVIDLLPTSQAWGPIYFACHDAPVILYQSPGLSHFLVELFKMSSPPYTSLVDDVHEDRLFNVWRKNPGVMSYDECIKSTNAQLKSFATQLEPSFQIIDMRVPEIGFGFSWGRYGAETVVRRHGNIPIFAYQKPVGILERFFKRNAQP
ncbi:MAG: SMI1/KNR4 family protein [Desulfomonilaceae bacterium]